MAVTKSGPVSSSHCVESFSCAPALSPSSATQPSAAHTPVLSIETPPNSSTLISEERKQSGGCARRVATVVTAGEAKKKAPEVPGPLSPLQLVNVRVHAHRRRGIRARVHPSPYCRENRPRDVPSSDCLPTGRAHRGGETLRDSRAAGRSHH